MSKEAMKLALDALDEFCELGAIIRPLEVRDALRKALAEPPTKAGELGAMKRDFWEGYVPEPTVKQSLTVEQPVQQEHGAWPCVIAEADFEHDTITLEMQCSDYKVGAGQHWLSTSQPAQQEPVAWGVFSGTNLHDMFFTEEEAQELVRLKGDGSIVQPLYTSPQPAQRKPLTDEQVNLFINGRGDEGDDDYVEPTGDGFGLTDADLVRLVRRVEAAHGIKENK